jgi:hypothetical protein
MARMARMESSGFIRCLWQALRIGILALALSVQATPLAAQSPPELQRLAEQVSRRLNLQSQFPLDQPPPFRFTLPIPPGEVLWLVIIVALGILLYAFWDMIPGRWSRRGAHWTTIDSGLDGQPNGIPPQVLGTADQLAARGLFVDAMHVLLLESLAVIRERLDEHFADSLTSREILSRTRLSESGRLSLRDIIARVEQTYFGDRPATHSDYVFCRSSFNVLAQALHERAPT